MKAMGAVKKAIGSLKAKTEAEGAPKATKLLERQHREVEALFEAIENAEGREKRALAEEIASNLVAHSGIEKELLYPRLQELDLEGILEAFEEHALVEHCLVGLLELRGAEEAFDAKVTVLKEVVRHHVKEEETHILPEAEKHLDEEELWALGEEMSERFEEIKEGDWREMLDEAVAATAPVSVQRRRPTAKATARRGPTKRRTTSTAAAKRASSRRASR